MNGGISMYILVSLIIPLSELIFVKGSPPLISHLGYDGNSSTIEGVDTNATTCNSNEECLITYTPGIEHALRRNASVAHEPKCVKGECTCGKYCLSKSTTIQEEEFYYCGPCGRVGSTCNSKCSSVTAICEDDGFCHCYNGGKFYEANFCFVPFYGYEFALEMAMVTCIIVILVLLVASLYNALGTRRLRHLHSIRALLREQNGTRESPPGDIPPKYDDVMQDLPTYQEALTMTMANGQDGIAEEGVINLAYQDDSGARNKENSAGADLSVTRRESSLAKMKRTIQAVHRETTNSQEENSEASVRSGGTTRHEPFQGLMMTNDHQRRVTSNYTQDQTDVTMGTQSTEIEESIGILALSAENEERTSNILSAPGVENRFENINQSIPTPNRPLAISNTSSSSLKLPLDDQSTTRLPILSSLKSWAAERKDAQAEALVEATVKIGNNQSQSSRTDDLAEVREIKEHVPSLNNFSCTPKPPINHLLCKTHELNLMSTKNADDDDENLAIRSESVV